MQHLFVHTVHRLVLCKLGLCKLGLCKLDCRGPAISVVQHSRGALNIQRRMVEHRLREVLLLEHALELLESAIAQPGLLDSGTASTAQGVELLLESKQQLVQHLFVHTVHRLVPHRRHERIEAREWIIDHLA